MITKPKIKIDLKQVESLAANGLTDELKAKLYQEMLEKSRGY